MKIFSDSSILTLKLEIKDAVLTSREAILPINVYKNMGELFNEINSACKRVDSHFYLERYGTRTSFSIECNEKECKLTHYIHFSDKLLKMLGIGDALLSAPKGTGTYFSMLTLPRPNSEEISTSIFVKLGFRDENQKYHKNFLSYEPFTLARGIPDKLFVYCDICEPYITGDVQTPLLRIVPVEAHGRDYEFGTNQVKHFSPLHYIPVRQTNFRTIEIDIIDEVGKKIPFESGTLTVTLHFKRID